VCGVAGLMVAAPRDDIGLLAREVSRGLRHRGPDDSAFWTDGDGVCDEHAVDRPASVVLAHRRLSIVDLDGGRQPMGNEDGTVWVTFNGEIYNHRPLREALERQGHVFGTRCDTEVLVHGWEEWGERLFGKLNGIYALALFDQRRDELIVARDPVGVKPLYVGSRDGVTWWSSELRAAIAGGFPCGQVSADALKLFFTFRFIPSPSTILEGVAKLPPGHFARIARIRAGEAPHFRQFASEIRSPAEPRGRGQWQEALIAGLEDAVRRQLMADVPVASLLSGGVDSTLITKMMVRHLPYAPHTYGIGFPSEGSLNEALAARRSAAALGVPHHSVLVDDDDFLRAWPGMFSYVGEPIANVGGLLVQLLCQRAAEEHKVVLTGQGADELLGGYPRHVVERLCGLGRRAPSLIPRLARPLLGVDNSARLQRALVAVDRADRYVDTFSVLSSAVVDELVSGGDVPAHQLARAAVERWMLPEQPRDTVNELLRVDTRMSLADDLLLIADHFSMRSSVELRVPFLDLEFLELVERMPSRYKVSTFGSRKWLYRRGASHELPAEVRKPLTGRHSGFRRKRGFNAPVTAWFESGGAIGRAEQWLERLADLSVLSADAVAKVAAEADDSQNARKRVALYALSTWLADGPLQHAPSPESGYRLTSGPEPSSSK
jgi:asparagine synthase (glutamine-hydrolysing)